MDVNSIINELKSLGDSGTRVPGFRGKVMIESDRLARLSEAIREGMPADIAEAQAIIVQKESIIDQANLEAKRIVEDAEKSATDMTSAANVAHDEKVSDSQVLQEASNRGDEITANASVEAQSIVQDAQRKAYALMSEAAANALAQREGADRYSMEVLSGLEEKLADVLGQVRRGIDTLRVQDDIIPPRNGVSV